MAKAKTETAVAGGVIETLNAVLAKMAQDTEAEADSHGVIKNEQRRQCIAKLDATIKFIEARWE